MKQPLLVAIAYSLCLANVRLGTEAFGSVPSSLTRARQAPSYHVADGTRLNADEGDGGADADAAEAATEAVAPAVDGLPDGDAARRTALKREFYQLSAAYDRGFGATPRARDAADDLLRRLTTLNPTTEAARGIDGEGGRDEEVPLRGIWRMVWTTAFDVVSLGASPFAAPSAIYQDISNPPVATNIIDFIPRAQTFLPPSVSPSSLLRAEVATRAAARKGVAGNNRVGLIFEGLKLQPLELLGQKVDGLPALSVDFLWPQTLLERLADFVPGLDGLGLGGDGDDNVKADAPGYFDVEYLDDELLVIRQQAPGGVFALVKVDRVM